nr:4-(cytidine 5'-diphospho)-2-C-methyl-D-erythritol kinase [uncultured Rhodopila sp.]
MLSERACAKINLHLHVVGRRPDGYHLLDSLVVFAGAADILTVERAGTLSLSVTGPFAAGLDNEADNLVLRAARALAVHADVPPAGRLVLEKNLPVASGIGGGSADAAAALRLLDRFWGIGAGQGTLAAIAGGLGADVPVCVASRSAVMSGIGEVLAPAPRMPEAGIVLVNPGVAVSTPAVFRARNGGFSVAAVWPPEGWPDAASLATSLHGTGNDLEAAALGLAPVIGEALAALAADPACLLARMSGSGATCFGIYADADVARAAADSVARPGWWVWGGGIIGG